MKKFLSSQAVNVLFWILNEDILRVSDFLFYYFKPEKKFKKPLVKAGNEFPLLDSKWRHWVLEILFHFFRCRTDEKVFVKSVCECPLLDSK